MAQTESRRDRRLKRSRETGMAAAAPDNAAVAATTTTTTPRNDSNNSTTTTTVAPFQGASFVQQHKAAKARRDHQARHPSPSLLCDESPIRSPQAAGGKGSHCGGRSLPMGGDPRHRRVTAGREPAGPDNPSGPPPARTKACVHPNQGDDALLLACDGAASALSSDAAHMAADPSLPSGGEGAGGRLDFYARQFALLTSKDEETRTDPCYLLRHSQAHLPRDFINENMRAICCGWTVELAMEFKFSQETLFLGIRIFDR